MKFAATCLLAFLVPLIHGQDESWEPGQDGGKETCQLQKDAVSFTVEPASVGSCDGCGFKVCMKLHDLGERKAIMKTCVKNSTDCNPPPFEVYKDTYWASKSVGVAMGYEWAPGDAYDAPTVDGSEQCQIVSGGKNADFSLVDGFRCQPPDPMKWEDGASITDVEVPGTGEKVQIECHSRPFWIKYLNSDPFGSCCTCTLAEAECVWRVTVPPCPPSPLPTPSPVIILETSPSPIPVEASPSPSPRCVCPTENEECKEELNLLGQQGYILEIDLMDCVDAQAAAEEINKHSPTGTYGCAASQVPNCNTIVCETYVPPSAYALWPTCPIPSPSPSP